MKNQIKQTVTFNCSPQQLYQLMTESDLHALFTKKPAHLSKKVGGKFRSYGKKIEGFNLELVKNKTMVLAWRTHDWDKNVYSIVTFNFHKAAGGKCKLVMTQTAIPSGEATHISDGWKEYFWNPIKTYLKESKRTRSRPRRAA